ncbi:hypothetical protein DID88_009868 [Monilinia fructigena]|uniref:Uncharacterized protein n=1 Tax=Monilinia fructigena TaxID=38457 RepID=A0A395IMZ6_9HELO|nr:hypothetical protein DID88_009868 [Monilinia fructigena]
MNRRDEDQSEDSPYGIPRSSSNYGTASNGNLSPTSTGLDLPAIAIPSDTLPNINPHLIESSNKSLDQGAIIGIIIAVVIIILFITGIIDVLLLSSRVQATLSKKTARFLKHYDRPPSRFPQPQWNSKFDSKPLPTIPDPAYFSKDIRPSEKRHSFNSGYSSRYSRSMSFDSGIGIHALNMKDAEGMGAYETEYEGMKTGYAKSFVPTIARRSWNDDTRSILTRYTRSYNEDIRPRMAIGKWEDAGDEEWSSHYEESIYTTDGVENPLPNPNDSRRVWNEESIIGTGGGSGSREIKRSKTGVQTYRGKIKVGMGVQKRHTMIFVREVEEVRRVMALQEQWEERDRVNFEIYRRFWR